MADVEKGSSDKDLIDLQLLGLSCVLDTIRTDKSAEQSS